MCHRNFGTGNLVPVGAISLWEKCHIGAPRPQTRCTMTSRWCRPGNDEAAKRVRCQKMAGLLGSIYPDGVIWPMSPIQLSPTKNWAFQTAALGLNPNFCGISSSTCGWKAFLSKMWLQDLGNIWHLREVTSKLFPSSEVCLARYLQSPHPWDFRVPASPLLLCYSLNTFWDDTNDMTSKTTCYLEGCLDSWRMIHHM